MGKSDKANDEEVRHSRHNIKKRRKSSSSSDDSSAEESKVNTWGSRFRERGLVKKIERIQSSRSFCKSESSASRHSHESSKKQETGISVKSAPKLDNAGGNEEWKEDKLFWEAEDTKLDLSVEKYTECKTSVWQVKTSNPDDDRNLCIVRISVPQSQRTIRQRRSSGHHHSHKEENEMDSQEKKKLCESPDEKRKTRKALKKESKNIDSAEETGSVVIEEIKYDIIPHSLDDIQLPDNMPSGVIRFKSPVSEKVEPCDTETCEPKDEEKTETQPDDVVPENLKETVSDEKIDNSDSNVEIKETELEKPDSDNCKELCKTEDIKERLEPLPTNESSETDAKEESSGNKTNRRDSSDRTSNERKSEERHFSSENSSPEKKRKSRDKSEDKSDSRDSSEDRDTSEERKGPRSSVCRPDPSSIPNNKERGRSRSRSSSPYKKCRSSSLEKITNLHIKPKLEYKFRESQSESEGLSRNRCQENAQTVKVDSSVDEGSLTTKVVQPQIEEMGCDIDKITCKADTLTDIPDETEVVEDQIRKVDEKVEWEISKWEGRNVGLKETCAADEFEDLVKENDKKQENMTNKNKTNEVPYCETNLDPFVPSNSDYIRLFDALFSGTPVDQSSVELLKKYFPGYGMEQPAPVLWPVITEDTPRIGIRGLNNEDEDTCWFNCSLQTLIALRPFQNFVMVGNYRNCYYELRRENGIFPPLADLFRRVWTPHTDWVLSNNEIRERVNQSIPVLATPGRHHPSSALELILRALQGEINPHRSPPLGMRVMNSVWNFLRLGASPPPVNRNFISSCFTGICLETRECTSQACEYTRRRRLRFKVWYTYVINAEPTNIVDLVNRSTLWTTPGLVCTICGSVSIRRRVEILRVPEVLLIGVIRLQQGGNTSVITPQEVGLTSTQQTLNYELNSLIQTTDATDNLAHVISIVKLNNHWYGISDRIFDEIPFNTIPPTRTILAAYVRQENV